MSTIARTVLAAAVIAGAAGLDIQRIRAETPAPPYNSDLFDLSDWKLTLPIQDEEDDDAAEIYRLVGYEHPDWFYDGPDGTMVFVAPVDGVTTGGSRYPRSELREMRNGDEAAWTLREGGTMTATLRVDQVPERDDGKPGRIIVGQIHGEDDELIRLYWQDGRVYFVNDRAGPDDDEMEFTLENAQGDEPAVGLGERFSYLIDARGDTLTVEVRAAGDLYRSVTPINAIWQSDVFYFKAGLYLGVNDETGSGIGQVSFYALDFGHAPGSGRAGLR